MFLCQTVLAFNQPEGKEDNENVTSFLDDNAFDDMARLRFPYEGIQLPAECLHKYVVVNVNSFELLSRHYPSK